MTIGGATLPSTETAAREGRSAGCILFVTTVSSTASHFLAPYASRLRGMGWRVDAAANGATRDPAALRAFDRTYDLPLSRSARDLRGFSATLTAIREILSSGYDIVHVHTPIASFLTRLSVRRLPANRRPKVVYTAHGFHFHAGGYPVTNVLFRSAERLAGRWTDWLVVINDEDAESALRYRIVPRDRVVRMPGIGLDTDHYLAGRISEDAVHGLRDLLGIATDAHVFVAIGDMNRNKRPTDAVQALAKMADFDAALVFVGDGPERGRVESLAAELGIERRVRVAGFLDDVRPALAAATALVMPSRREGLARSVQEALALGVPVVASAARGNRELVNGDGFVVAIGDTAAMSRAMDWLITHPAERLAMGVRGRARMIERYDLRKLIERHVELYEQVLRAP